MKKISLLWLILLCFFFAWCGNQHLWEWESIYAGNLIIAWVWPEISFESTVKDWTLVLKWYFEDHSDHIFLNQWVWEKYFENEFDYLPWNEVNFKWVVEFLDWAAGNHYYNVKSVEKLEVKKYPNADGIKNLFEWYNYCETDSDCWYFIWECPLWCYIPMNVKYIDIASNIVTNFVNHLWDERCVYSCLSMNKAVCNDYKCEMIDAPAEADVHGCSPLYKDSDFEQKNPELACDDSIHAPVCANDWKTYVNDCYACVEPLVESYTFWECETDSKFIICTPEQKNADICTMQYEPVCGSDSRTYWNSCVACQSETVESYTQWECESSAFTVEWDSEYLEEALGILNKNWAVTCDLFYTDYDRQVHSFFMADFDKFYSAIDDYSENLQRNVIYTLAIDGKIYNWDTFTGSEKVIIDYPADIESEIANLLLDKSKYSNFEMNCYGWVDVANEHLFLILPE